MSADGASDIKIKIFSWNVGNEMPDKEELAEWLPESSGDEFDIVVVGTQECSFKAKKKAASTDLADTSGAETEELEPEKPEIGPNLTQREIEKDAYLWDRMVSARLGKSYGLVKRVVLWQMRLSVYAKASHLRDKTIHHVQTATSATGGVGGLLGNKGGLVVKLDFGLTSLVFVSCHLAAHSHKLEQRNQNCEEIIRETGKMLGTRYLDLVSQFDHCFWFGDLNYRVDLNAAAELPAGEPPPYGEGETAAHISAARELAEKGDFASLYAADQLSRCQARGEAFGGFTDATPTGFAPTFKVRRQSGTVYKEQRVPSYCDRVLWKSMPPLARCVSKLSFDSLPQVSTSDHKPVLATFAVTPTELMGASPSGMAQGPDAREVTGRDEKKKIGTFRHGSRRPPPASLLLSSSASLRKMSASMTHQLPLIRIQSLQLVGMKDADVGGGSDPYCIFLSNPLDLFSVGGRVPISTVKHTDRRLRWCTLVIAIYDQDRIGDDDLLGMVMVPLAPPGESNGGVEATQPLQPLPEEYTIDIDQPLTNGNTSSGFGAIKARFTVSFGSKLPAALESAAAVSAGSKAASLKADYGEASCSKCTIT